MLGLEEWENWEVNDASTMTGAGASFLATNTWLCLIQVWVHQRFLFGFLLPPDQKTSFKMQRETRYRWMLHIRKNTGPQDVAGAATAVYLPQQWRQVYGPGLLGLQVGKDTSIVHPAQTRACANHQQRPWARTWTWWSGTRSLSVTISHAMVKRESSSWTSEFWVSKQTIRHEL